MRLLFLPILILGFAFICFSQTTNKSESFRLIQTKPSAYISFEKFGARKPRYQDESNEGIWLRFHNNTKWNLTVLTLACRDIQEECLLFYEVARMNSFESKISESEIPIGYRMAHISSKQTIPSGKSVLFSMPKEHLAEGLYISLNFSYEWESTGGGYIDHTVYFYSGDLPKENK